MNVLELFAWNKLKPIKFCRMLGLIFCLLMATVLSADFDSKQPRGAFRIGEAEGIVRSLDVENNRVQISGSSFQVAFDAKIEIGGTFGAFTLLKPGMKVSYMVRGSMGNYKVIVSIKQLSDNYALDEY